MNRNKLKTYAPKARRAFIQAVTARASKFGINASWIEPVQVQGDVALIGGQAFPRKVAEQRRKLEERIALRGFEQVMEEAAYTWFNRFAAIRFMEVHDYLDHGYRVLSHPEGKATPEIIEHAEHIDLPGLNRVKIIDLKLNGTKDEELYRMLLMAQCNALHAAMPFLFERIDDETELLLPDNLLHSDSLIRQLIGQIEEADWHEIEIIGWLYQFYISEKKEEVIGKVVQPEDIPAATQLFTPNWIVKYMVQNSLGAKWLAIYPHSGIRSRMDYYVDSAEQTYKVKAKLSQITPAELSPEDLTLLDPACGSGHILVEAYDLLKDIYLECGYRLREIPKLILEINLHGIEIDDRAVQLSNFALLMKARADDREIFSKSPKMNTITIQDSGAVNIQELHAIVSSDRFELVPNDDLLPNTITQPSLSVDIASDVDIEGIQDLINLFSNATTFGSLLEVPDTLKSKLPSLVQWVCAPRNGSTLDARLHEQTIDALVPLVRQATILANRYEAVVANPPYMGAQYQSADLKAFLAREYHDFRYDLYAAFAKRIATFVNDDGFCGMMTPFTWLSKSNYARMRNYFVSEAATTSLIQPEYHAFFDSAYVPICTFSFRKTAIPEYIATFVDLGAFVGAESQAVKLTEALKQRDCGWLYEVPLYWFKAIPSIQFAFSLPAALLNAFRENEAIGSRAKKGITTGDNTIFMRAWSEIDKRKFSRFKGKKWFPVTKGGDYRKWYGNFEYVLNWEENGKDIANFVDARGNPKSSIRGLKYQMHEGITWNDVTISDFTARYVPPGYLFSAAGPMIFTDEIARYVCFLNSKVNVVLLRALCPSMKFEVGAVAQIPVGQGTTTEMLEIFNECVSLAKENWDTGETSWNFTCNPLFNGKIKGELLEESSCRLAERAKKNIERMRVLEERNNRIFIEQYNLSNEISADVHERDITLKRTNRIEDIKGLVSYSIGCMMGRYSLVDPGLIYADGGNEEFDASRYGDFPADNDGIIPIIEADWFSDDAANRFAGFIKVAWSPETLKENLKFVADSLGAKANETPMDTIRRYLSRDFYKDHLKTYKKRPIYWLFSSGREKAFECLVYLHRYNEGTLSRMRMEYVTPLQGRVSARIEQLDRDIQTASTTAAQNKLRKEQEKLKKQQAELIKFDDELRHCADRRIKLDLDDGVKVNYGKFGNLLAEVKTVTGGSDE